MTTKIAKQSGWLDAINTYIAANEITMAGWSTDGVSFQNGVTEASGAPVKYNKVIFGKVKALLVVGWVKFPTINSGAGVVGLTLPKNLFADKTTGDPNLQVGHNGALYNGGLMTVDIDPSTGQVKFTNDNSDSVSGDTGMELDLLYFY